VSELACCLCRRPIRSGDPDALQISFTVVERPWPEGPEQSLYAHFDCTRKKVQPALNVPLHPALFPVA
jgi:hypothetical protein